MNRKKWAWSFLAGAILTAVLVHLLLVSSTNSLLGTLPEAVGATARMPSGQITEIQGVFLWVILELSLGMMWYAGTTIFRKTFNSAKRKCRSSV